MSYRMNYDVDDIIAEGAKKRAKAAQSGEILMPEEKFKSISHMSYREIECLIDEIESNHPGFRNLIGKKGIEGFRYYKDKYVSSQKERADKEESSNNMLIDDSESICDDYKKGRNPR